MTQKSIVGFRPDFDKDYLPEVFFANRLLYDVLRKESALSTDDIKVLQRAKVRVESMIEGMNVVSGASKVFSGVEPISAYRLALDIIPSRFEVKTGKQVGKVLKVLVKELDATIKAGVVGVGSLKTAMPFFEEYQKRITRYQQQQAMDRFGF